MPWEMQAIDCDLSFLEVGKNGHPVAIDQHFKYLQAKYRCAEYYTDASKSSAVACAAHGPAFSESRTMNEHTSIFTAECYGILLAVTHILKEKEPASIIYTDSLSAVTALSSTKILKNPVTNTLRKCIMSARKSKLKITLCWIPGHCNIAGNEIADKLAKSAALRPSVDVDTIPYEDLRPLIISRMRRQWQEEWNAANANKLHLVKPRIGRYVTEKRNRHQEVALCRLRIGHTHATHSHLLKNSPAPHCAKCGDELSVVHVLITCPYLEPERLCHFSKLYKCHIPPHPQFFLGDDPLFPPKVVLKFLASVGFLHSITYSH